MADWDDVRAIALALPGAEEYVTRGSLAWRVGRLFVWERPLRTRDIEEVGPADGPILGARVEDEAEKAALIAAEPEAFFTTSHFDGHPIVLARLDRLERERLVELVESAWAEVARPDVVAAYFGPPPLVE
jgi:hypothetical protein